MNSESNISTNAALPGMTTVPVEPIAESLFTLLLGESAGGWLGATMVAVLLFRRWFRRKR